MIGYSNTSKGHFDIAEIFARKLNKGIGEYQFNRTSFQKRS
jgi:hypothetical protein